MNPLTEQFVQQVIPLLSNNELRLFLFISNECFGHGDYRHHITFQDMVDNVKLSPAETVEALQELVKYSLVYEHDELTENGRLYAIPAMPDIEGLNKRRNNSEG